MQVDISFKNLESSAKVKEFAEEKSNKLKKFFDGRLHVKWIFSQESDRYVSHLQIFGNSIDLHAESQDDNWFSSIESSVDKIEAQLKKHKEKLTSHHR